MNMSYCRFQNTASDLDDCQTALEDLMNKSGKLSRDELKAAKKLAATCLDIVLLMADCAHKEIEELESDDCDAVLDELNDCAGDEE